MKRKPGNINLTTLRRLAGKLGQGIKVAKDYDPEWCVVSYPVERRALKRELEALQAKASQCLK